MSKRKYLVTGATGATGGATVDALIEAGQDVRALAHRDDERSDRLRERGAEVVLVDFSDRDSIGRAVEGVSGAYFCYPISRGIVETTALFAHAAKRAGMGAVVNMSQAIAREDARSHASYNHWLSERVFDWSGLAVTHLRPGFFAEWLLSFAPMIREGTIFAPFGDGRCAFIAAKDQGRVIAAILQNPGAHRGKTYPPTGPVEHTFAEAAGVVGRVLGRHVAYHQVSFEAMAEAILGRTRGLPRNDALSGYAELNPPDAAGGRPSSSTCARPWRTTTTACSPGPTTPSSGSRADGR